MQTKQLPKMSPLLVASLDYNMPTDESGVESIVFLGLAGTTTCG